MNVVILFVKDVAIRFENCNAGDDDDELPHRIGECKDCQKPLKSTI